MRKNKRNLLVAIASMGLVAAGTGAVSTFAWYTASTSVSLTGVGSDSIATASVGIDDVDINVNMTISAVETNLELTNWVYDAGDSGPGKYETWYLVNDALVQKTGSMTQSQTFTVTSIAFDTTDPQYKADLLLAKVNSEYTVTLAAGGQTHFLSGAIASNTTALLDVASVSFKIKIVNNTGVPGLQVVTASGLSNCTATTTTVTGNYRIQANTLDASGAETAHGVADTISVSSIA